MPRLVYVIVNDNKCLTVDKNTFEEHIKKCSNHGNYFRKVKDNVYYYSTRNEYTPIAIRCLIAE